MSLQSGGQSIRALLSLRQHILSGRYPTGMRLREVALAEDLDISRTPIRAALSALADEGLVERVAGRGFRVRTFAAAEILDSIELRGMIEGACARFAAERGVPEEALAEMEAVLREMDLTFGPRGTMDFQKYSEDNKRLHAFLPQWSGSAVYERELDRVTRLPFAAPSAFIPAAISPEGFVTDMRHSHRQHWALFEAIGARQGARAEALMREHCRGAMASFQRFAAGRDEEGLVGELPGLSLFCESG